jgi:hypothetical protein
MGKKPAAKSLEAAKTTKKEKVADAGIELKTTAKKTKAKKVETAPVAKADKHCQIKSCKREYRAKGYCAAHYKKWRQGEYGLARYKTCKDAECKKPMVMNRKGYCEDHYVNFYVKGNKPVHAPAEKAEAPKKEEKEAASA